MIFDGLRRGCFRRPAACESESPRDDIRDCRSSPALFAGSILGLLRARFDITGTFANGSYAFSVNMVGNYDVLRSAVAAGMKPTEFRCFRSLWHPAASRIKEATCAANRHMARAKWPAKFTADPAAKTGARP